MNGLPPGSYRGRALGSFRPATHNLRDLMAGAVAARVVADVEWLFDEVLVDVTTWHYDLQEP